MLKPELYIILNHTWNIKTQAFIRLYIEKQRLYSFSKHPPTHLTLGTKKKKEQMIPYYLTLIQQNSR